MKELADGTLRIQVDIDPQFRAQFFQWFGQIDMPIALAPLVADFEEADPEPEPQSKPKGGSLARLAGHLCNDPEFQQFVSVTYKVTLFAGSYAEDCAQWLRDYCGVSSRAEIDGDQEATEAFHRVRGGWIKWRAARGLS